MPPNRFKHPGICHAELLFGEFYADNRMQQCRRNLLHRIEMNFITRRSAIELFSVHPLRAVVEQRGETSFPNIYRVALRELNRHLLHREDVVVTPFCQFLGEIFLERNSSPAAFVVRVFPAFSFSLIRWHR